MAGCGDLTWRLFVLHGMIMAFTYGVVVFGGIMFTIVNRILTGGEDNSVSDMRVLGRRRSERETPTQH